MTYTIDNQEYEVIITKKNNKNTYIRVKEDLKIYVSTHYLVTKNQIKKLLNQSDNYLRKAIREQIKKLEKHKQFLYLGQAYDIIEISSLKQIDIDDIHHLIYTKDINMLNRWLKKEILNIFETRYKECFNIFKECQKIPVLKIRNMKSRWGVYNRMNHSITLNSRLIEYKIEDLDYVIYHELSHTKYFDHSKKFWDLVEYYCPDYKKAKKDLKE